MSPNSRDHFDFEATDTPLTCPICGGELLDTRVRTMGTITAEISWKLHCGMCEEHGWFQAESVGKPPRDIFAVTKPFGTSRRLIVNGREVYQFPTVWSEVDFGVRMNKHNPVDPLDPRMWKALPIE